MPTWREELEQEKAAEAPAEPRPGHWRRFELSVSREKVPMGQAQVPRTFACHLLDFEDGSPNIDILWTVEGGSPVCREVHIAAVDGGREVTCSGLAGVRVEDMLEKTMKALIWEGDASHRDDPERWSWPSGQVQREGLRELRAARARRRVKVTDDMLQEVARVYRACVTDKPTQSVADHFGVGHRTATRYVAQARQAGHLGAAIKGKAGEQ